MTLHITCQFPDNAKARIRTALKLLGASAVRIEEVQQAPSAPKLVKDNLPTSPEAKAMADLFGRKHTTQWADREITAFRKLRTQGVMTMDNLAIITSYYTKERKKEQHYCRRDLMTLLNNFQSELDRAMERKPASSRKGEWLDSTSKVIPMTPDADAEEIRRKAREAAEQFKKQHSA